MYRAPSGTAFSVNIEELPKLFWALFDVGVNLIADALHIPVPFGSMGSSIKTVLLENAGKMRPGDV
jgi:5-oxoprolinase (ATP-hydrolysing)